MRCCLHCGRQENTWMRMLAALERGPMTTKQLCADLHVSRTAVSVRIGRLVAAGLIDCGPHDEWPRRYRLSS